MKIVTFNKRMLPWQPGDSRAMSDEEADKIVAGGFGSAKPWPDAAKPAAPRETLHTKRYLTRKREAS